MSVASAAPFSDQTTGTLWELLAQQAAIAPNAAAILAPDRHDLTYEALREHSVNIATWLGERGIGRNDRLALALPDGPEAAVAFISLSASAPCAPLNPASSSSEFDYYLSDLNARALIIPAGSDSPAISSARRRGISVLELMPEPSLGAGCFTLAGEFPVGGHDGSLMRPDDVALLLYTSGTSARPKLVALTHRNLWHAAHNICAAVQLTRADRCLNAMPLFHIHGLSMLYASLAVGASVVCASEFSGENFFRWLRAFSPTWYSAAPAIHQIILQHAQRFPADAANARLRFLRSASAPMPARIISELETVFQAPFVEAYGMTEAGPQIASNRLPPHPRKPGSVGPAAGPEIAIVNEAGDLLPPDVAGEVVIRGPNVISGYVESAANDNAFVDGWFRTGDLGRLDDAGHLYITGRTKEVINRGGEKISPREIDEALLDHPAVVQAAAYAVPHSVLGEDVAAAVVLDPEFTTSWRAVHRSQATERLAQDIRQTVARRLAPFKVPREIEFVDQLPNIAGGKLRRIDLAHRLREVKPPQPVGGARLPTRSSAETVLTDIVADVLGIAPPNVNDNFFKLGGHSLAAAQVVARIEKQFSIDLPATILFECPTVAELTVQIGLRIADLAAAGRLVISSDRSAVGKSVHSHGVARRSELGPCRLSFAQQRMWLLVQMANSAAYHVSATLRLTGPVDETALKRSVDELVRRHESLRTTFRWQHDQPVQVIEVPQPCNLPLYDLSNRSPAQQESDALGLATEETQRLFDLERGPLFRTALVRLNPREHFLVLTMHHIIADGWSVDVLHRELRLLYASFLNGEAPRLPALPCQYADYAIWQRERLSGDYLEQKLTYWRKQLQRLPPPLELHTDRPRPAVRTTRGARLLSEIDLSTTTALRALSEREGATLFMTCLAAFKLLLMRHTGQCDVVIGSPIAHRSELESEALIGFFANTLVLRTDLSGNPTFQELLGRVSRMAKAAYAHQEVPFEKLVDEIQPDRDPSRMPLFQIMFAFQNYPSTATTVSPNGERTIEFAGGLSARTTPIDSEGAKFDVTLYLSETSAGLQATWQYNADLFDRVSIKRLASRFQALLGAIATNSQQRLAELPIVSGDEASLTVERSWAAESAQPASSFLEAFSSRVEQTPNATAIECGDEQLTYFELNGQANRLARYLRKMGVGPETLVGVLLPRSSEMVISLLAVCKAGGAFLPLDLEHPDERIAHLLNDSQAALLITNNFGRPRIESYISAQTKLICWETEQAEINCESPEPLACLATPQNLAYVIYTSGSTGSPKGVMITHDNVGHYVEAMREALNVEANDRYLHTASFAFSSSVRQWALPLYCGAAVIIATADQCRDPEALFTVIRNRQVSVLDLVPSHWRACWQMLECLAPTTRGLLLDNRLRLMLSASEPLPSDLAQKCSTLAPSARLINMYGQTETTGIVSVHTVLAAEASDASITPIGRSIATTRLHVLDAAQRPVPIGVAGEAYISGPSVGRGYWNQPELTKQRFIADPFQPDRNQCLYRTGDIVRHRTDGIVEFLGRADQQIKIRGHRIDPAEIEAVLQKQSGVAETVVMGGERLTAIVARTGTNAIYGPRNIPTRNPWASALREHLRRKLPDYMVPSVILECDALPRNPNGKIDRAALVAIVAADSGKTIEESKRLSKNDYFKGPRTQIEGQLLDIWRRVLGRDDIGVDDNFFDVGGDSLLSVQVISQAKDAGLEFSLSQLFQHQTIAELAAQAESAVLASALNDMPTRRVATPSLDDYGDDTVYVDVAALRAYGREALESVGLATTGAEIVTEVQIEATLRGQPTHNFASIPRYARRIAAGKINPRPRIKIDRETAVSALVDGDNGPGQWVAMTAIEIAIAKAKENGVAIVSVRRSNHFGAAGQYVWQAARAGLVGLGTTNGPVILAPTGGVTPTFGNNPLAVGVPALRYDPILLDAAMSVAPRGKIGLHVAEGKPLPSGWILDRFGRPSTDLADLAAGLGAPIGGHKGYGIALAMEILAGVLSGAGFGWDHGRQQVWRNTAPPDIGHFFVVIDPQLFMPTDEFKARVDKMIEQAKTGERAEGVSEILIPGEAELRARNWHLQHGAPLRPSAYRSLMKYATQVGLTAKLPRLSVRSARPMQ